MSKLDLFADRQDKGKQQEIKQLIAIGCVALVLIIATVVTLVVLPSAGSVSTSDADSGFDYFADEPDGIGVSDSVQYPVSDGVQYPVSDGDFIGEQYPVSDGDHHGELDVADTDTPKPEQGLSESSDPINLEGTPSQKELDYYSKLYNCVGVSVAVIEKGRLSYTYQYGYADMASGRKVNADTKFYSSSLSEIVLAMTAVSMQESGLLSLDDEVGTLLGCKAANPNYPKAAITLNSLFTHTSSLKKNFKHSTSFETVLSKAKYYQNKKPGSQNAFLYNSNAVAVAGSAMEIAAQSTVADYTDKWLFSKLGVDASFAPSRIKDSENISVLYNAKNKVEASVSDQLSVPYSETPGENRLINVDSLTISPQDLAKVLCVLINDGDYCGTSYLSPESVAAIEKSYYKIDPFYQCLVLRYRGKSFNGRSLYYHIGNSHGMLGSISYDAKTGDGVVVMTSGCNSSEIYGGLYRVCAEITQYCYRNVISK